MELNLCSGTFCLAFPNLFLVKSCFSVINYFLCEKRDLFSSFPVLFKQELFPPTSVLQEYLMFVKTLHVIINYAKGVLLPLF